MENKTTNELYGITDAVEPSKPQYDGFPFGGKLVNDIATSLYRTFDVICNVVKVITCLFVIYFIIDHLAMKKRMGKAFSETAEELDRTFSEFNY